MIDSVSKAVPVKMVGCIMLICDGLSIKSVDRDEKCDGVQNDSSVGFSQKMVCPSSTFRSHQAVNNDQRAV